MEKILTPIKAIRAKCLDCCCWQSKEVKLCTMPDCSLFPYRLGKRPVKEGGKVRKKRILTEEHKRKLQEGRKKKKGEKNESI